MTGLDSAQRVTLQAALDVLIDELREQIALARPGARPVDLDEPIGRISRMDAIQQQSMVQANLRAAQQRLAHAEAALRRLEEDVFGECVTCGEDVGFARLEARPEAALCVACQTRREGAR